MPISLFIMTAVTSVFSVFGVISAIRLFTVIRALRLYYDDLEKDFASGNKNFPHVLIFIPVLRETKILKNTFVNFSQILYPKEKLKIIIITTEKEFESGYFLPNSIEMTRKEIARLNESAGIQMFFHIHYPLISGVKSDQLNYAIKQILVALPKSFNKETYIGIYDADSLTPINTLELLAQDAIQNHFPNVYQQPTLYFKNYQILGNGITNFLARSFAFLQTIYAISYETRTFLKQSKIIRKNSRFILRHRMRYCVGHGLFVRWPYLQRIGLFPSPIEDTRLGHIVSYLGEDIKTLPTFDTVEVVCGITKAIKQSSTWFFGEAMFLDDLKIAKKIQSVPVNRMLWLSFYKFYRNVIWILKGPIFGIFIVWLFLTNNFLLLFTTIFFFLYFPILIFIAVSKRMRPLLNTNLPAFKMDDLLLFAFIPLEFVLMSAGPLFGFFKFCFWRITKRPLILYKTERK